MVVFLIACNEGGVVLRVIDLHNDEWTLEWCCRRVLVSGFMICLMHTSFWLTIDCASSVLYYVIV